MPRGTKDARYTPSAVPELGNVLLTEWLRRELRSIQAGFEFVNDYDVLTSPPDRVKEGMARYADGVEWNPGAGKGLYLYDGAAWNKL
jgi:hypothetical protein